MKKYVCIIIFVSSSLRAMSADSWIFSPFVRMYAWCSLAWQKTPSEAKAAVGGGVCALIARWAVGLVWAVKPTVREASAEPPSDNVMTAAQQPTISNAKKNLAVGIATCAMRQACIAYIKSRSQQKEQSLLSIVNDDVYQEAIVQPRIDAIQKIFKEVEHLDVDARKFVKQVNDKSYDVTSSLFTLHRSITSCYDQLPLLTVNLAMRMNRLSKEDIMQIQQERIGQLVQTLKRVSEQKNQDILFLAKLVYAERAACHKLQEQLNVIGATPKQSV